MTLWRSWAIHFLFHRDIFERIGHSSGQRNDSILSHPPFTDTVHLPGMHAAFAIKHRIIKGEFSSTTMWVHPCNSTMPLLPYIRSQHDSSSKSLVGNGFWRLPEISHPVPRIKSFPEVRIKAKAMQLQVFWGSHLTTQSCHSWLRGATPSCPRGRWATGLQQLLKDDHTALSSTVSRKLLQRMLY